MISIKDMAKSLYEAGKIEEYNLIIELQQKSIDDKEVISNLKDEKRILLKKIEKIEEKLKIDGKKTIKNDTYYFGEEGPFCMRCYDSESKAIRLPISNCGYDTMCLECKSVVNFTGKAADMRHASYDMS